MIPRTYFERPRFFLQKPGLLAVCRLIYNEARKYLNTYTIIEMSPGFGRLRFERVLRAMRARASRFHQVRELVISDDMLDKAFWVAKHKLLHNADHVGITRDDFPNLEVIVWPNGEDSSNSKDKREAAVRYCFDKPYLQLVDQEYDVCLENGEIYEGEMIYDDDVDSDDDDSDNEHVNNDKESDYEPSDDDEEVSNETGSIEDLSIDDEDLHDVDRKSGWDSDDGPQYILRHSGYSGYPRVAKAGSLRLVARSPKHHESSDE